MHLTADCFVFSCSLLLSLKRNFETSESRSHYFLTRRKYVIRVYYQLIGMTFNYARLLTMTEGCDVEECIRNKPLLGHSVGRRDGKKGQGGNPYSINGSAHIIIIIADYLLSLGEPYTTIHIKHTQTQCSQPY